MYLPAHLTCNFSQLHKQFQFLLRRTSYRNCKHLLFLFQRLERFTGVSVFYVAHLAAGIYAYSECKRKYSHVSRFLHCTELYCGNCADSNIQNSACIKIHGG